MTGRCRRQFEKVAAESLDGVKRKEREATLAGGLAQIIQSILQTPNSTQNDSGAG
jgi:hypothetical protein